MDFPPAWRNGPLTGVFPDVFFVTGGMRFPGPVTVTVRRSMTVVRTGGSLTP